MAKLRNWLGRFAVRGVFWREYLDWAIANIPFYIIPFLIWFWTVFFFFFAAPARRALLANLSIVLPGSGLLANYLRVWWTMHNFAWTLTEGSQYKQKHSQFSYQIEGESTLRQLATGKGAIVLTAHMGNYDLGAALFAEKFGREIRMVRAPEPDERTARHLDESLEKTGAGAVRVDYTTDQTLLSFDLLHALRADEIVSIQGDRVIGDGAQSRAQLFGHDIFFPVGPFMLAQIAERPIYPLFIVRLGFRRYKIIVRDPIICQRTGPEREGDIAVAVRQWSDVLQAVIARHWDQWFAFVPAFTDGIAAT